MTKLVHFLYYVRDQITSLLANLDKNGIVFVMDSGKLLCSIRLLNIYLYNILFINVFFRWRKHKCNLKNRNRLLNGLKKCTCFSTNGNLYTKLEMDKNKKYNSK